MNNWNRDGRGNVKVSPVVGWKAATLVNSEADVFLRLEFSVNPDNTDVSALQFALTERQAREIGAELKHLADRLSFSALQPS